MIKHISKVLRNRKGSNSVEYLIFFAAVVSVAIVFAGPMNRSVTMSYNSVTDGMSDMSQRLTTSRPPTLAMTSSSGGPGLPAIPGTPPGPGRGGGPGTTVTGGTYP